MHILLENIPEYQTVPIDVPSAPFIDYVPDLDKIEKTVNEINTKGYKRLIIIGHGGSITSFVALVGSLGSNKEIEVLSTVDPMRIFELRELADPAETLVIAISKSGETVTQIEALLHFLDYPLLCITGLGSTLDQIGRNVGAQLYEHPPIGGRYTAFTEVALLPAAICGINIRDVYAGAKELYAQYNKANMAFDAAQIFFHLEEQGYMDVFMPFYSKNLYALSGVIVQLCHESFGKKGVGQTYFAHESPESQHHTNQRFFGGRKNIAGFFTTVEQFPVTMRTVIPEELRDIHIKDGTLEVLNGNELAFSMQAEFLGTWQDAKMSEIPIAALELENLSAQEIGKCLAFWQLYAIYSSLLRSVDPFDQPQVEASKNISWTIRKNKS